MKLSFGGPTSRPLREIFADGTNMSSCVSTRQKTEGLLHMGLRNLCVADQYSKSTIDSSLFNSVIKI